MMTEHPAIAPTRMACRAAKLTQLKVNTALPFGARRSYGSLGTSVPSRLHRRGDVFDRSGTGANVDWRVSKAGANGRGLFWHSPGLINRWGSLIIQRRMTADDGKRRCSHPERSSSGTQSSSCG